MQKLACCDVCIIKPHKCHYHLNTCRDTLWAEKNCFIPHYVYLSKTSDIKVGITKFSQIPFRWIDQGAVQALPIIRTYSRYQAGLVESIFKNYTLDKTNWKKMLLYKNDNNKNALLERKIYLLRNTLNTILKINKKLNIKIDILNNSNPIDMVYPIKSLPNTVKLIKSDDDNYNVSDHLIGIKGQYLIFEKGVMNMRGLCGHEMSIEIDPC